MRETSTRYGSLPVDICRKMAEGTWAAQGCRRAWEPESLCHPREDVVFDWFEHCDLDAVMRKAKFKPSSSRVPPPHHQMSSSQFTRAPCGVIWWTGLHRNRNNHEAKEGTQLSKDIFLNL